MSVCSHVTEQYEQRPFGIATWRAIARGDWAPDQAIPSEQQLRQEYGLANGTVRQAIRLLVEEGVVVVMPQRGTFVRPVEKC